jgi:hypothetical protein
MSAYSGHYLQRRLSGLLLQPFGLLRVALVNFPDWRLCGGDQIYRVAIIRKM